jgi:hypothetical protein
MTEFTAEIKRPARPVTLYIAIAVAVVAVTALVVAVRYQKNNPVQESRGPVVVPGIARAGDPNFEAYKDQIRIERVKAYINLNFAGNRSASIEGIISNEGSRKLEAVEMHLKLYDVYGKLSKERTAIPMRPGIGINKGPMEPLEKRTFTVWIESVEQLWNPKRVEIEITGLKYQ